MNRTLRATTLLASCAALLWVAAPAHADDAGAETPAPAAPELPAWCPDGGLGPAPDGGARERWSGPGWDVVVVGGRAVVLDADFVHVRGVTLEGGRQAWRRRVQRGEPRGLHVLARFGDTPWLHAGGELFAIDPARGRARGPLRVIHAQGRCQLVDRAGAQAFVCEQGLWPVDLNPKRSGERALGPFFPTPEIRMYPGLGLEGEPMARHETLYGRVGQGVLGAVGGVRVYAVTSDERDRDAGGSMFRADTMLVGVDAGDEVTWRRRDLVRRDFDRGGVHGDLAWAFSAEDGVLGAVLAEDGELAWRVTLVGVEAVSQPPGADLVLALVDGEVRAYGLDDGEVRWRRPAGAATRVLAVGDIELLPLYAREEGMRLVVATESGDLTPLTLPPWARLVADPRGGVAILSHESVDLLTPEGAPRRRLAPAAHGPFELTERHLLARTAAVFTVIDRDSDAVRGCWPTHTLWKGEGPTGFALWQPGATRDEPGTVRVVATRP